MLLWIDGFEGYGTSTGNAPSPTNIMARRYPYVVSESSVDIETGRIDGYCVQFPNHLASCMTPAINSNATIIVGFAFKYDALETAQTFLTLYDGATVGVYFRFAAGGEISILCANFATATTSGLGLVAGVWYQLELKVVVDDAAGSYELRIGGVNVLSGNTLDTKTGTHAYYDIVQLRSGTTSQIDIYFDDFYVCNGAGSDNNNFLGNMHVLAIYPDGDGSSSDWTPNSLNNYEEVDDAILDSDTSYVESNTVNHVDLYTYGAASSVNIKGIQINTDCRETGAETYSLITEIRSGGNTYDDTPQVIGTVDYITKRLISEEDPNTSNQWLAADINSAEFGIKVS